MENTKSISGNSLTVLPERVALSNYNPVLRAHNDLKLDMTYTLHTTRIILNLAPNFGRRRRWISEHEYHTYRQEVGKTVV